MLNSFSFLGISGVAAVRKRGRSNNNGRPPSDEFGQLHRNSTVIDGELLLKKGQIAPVPDAVSLVSEGKIKQKYIPIYRKQQLWIIIPFFPLTVLDAEVTALTNSSPGSSNGSTERSTKSSNSNTKAILQHAKRNLEEVSPPDRSTSNSSTSGIARWGKKNDFVP